MNKRLNTHKDVYRRSKLKFLALSAIVIATLVATLSVLKPTSVNAQLMGEHGKGLTGNMTSGQQQQQQHEQRMIKNGTINLEQVIFQAINSRVNISLTQAMTAAERSIGNDAFAVAGFGSEEGGYFAYRIILATPGMKFYYVKADPGNGQILEIQQVSQKELDKMHKEHSAMVVSNSGEDRFGVSGFPFIIPH
jgi:uncharacterized membrane protein YkoI